MLSKIRHYVPTSELRSIYYAIFSSHMTYGSQVWGQAITTHTEKIFKLQNRALRIIDFADFRADVDPIYAKNLILKLEDQIKFQNCLFVFDFLHKKLPECFDNYFTKLDEIYSEEVTTINSELGCLFTPFMSTLKYGLQSITRQCITSWNFFTREFNTDLSKLSRPMLKNKISSYFFDKYDPQRIHHNNNNNRGNNRNNTNNNRQNNNNNNGLRVLRWQRPNHAQLRANAQNFFAQNPYATRWDNQLRNF